MIETVDNIMNKDMSHKKTRNSSIELLKILGIILIVLSHAVPIYGNKEAISYINLNLATNDISEFILIVFRNLGQVGNILFIMCSAYFLIDSRETKAKKILHIIFDSFTISVLFLVIYLLCMNNNISIKVIIKQLLPITFENNWFIGCYIMLYIIHPFLNKIIKSNNKNQLLKINVFLIILYCLVCSIFHRTYYYTRLVGFIVIYFIVAYNRLYLQKFNNNKNLNIKLFIIGISLYIGELIITNLLGLKIDFFKDKMMYWNDINNIFGIMIGISMLNLFKNKYFESKVINYISSLSLLIYITSENYFFRTYTKPLFYQNVFQYGHILFWVLIEAILLIIFGIIISSIYKQTLQKFVYKISDKIYIRLNKIWEKVEPIMLKLN